MEFVHDSDIMMIHQKDYVEDIMKSLNIKNITPVKNPQPDGLYRYNETHEHFDMTLYQRAIGKLIWLSICTRPDLAFYVSYYASLMANPTVGAWKHLVQLISYAYYTRNFGIVLKKDGIAQINMFVDAGHANEILWRRSTIGYALYFLGNLVHWGSHKIHTVVKSSMEAEYIALSDASLEAKFIQNVLKDLWSNIKPIMTFTDNEAARKVATGTGQVRKVKHLETHYHLVRQMNMEGEMDIKWIPTAENCADILTKHVGSDKTFRTHQTKLVTDLSFYCCGGVSE